MPPKARPPSASVADNSMTPLTAKISAIITATSDAMFLRLRLPDGGAAWHQTETELILKDQRGQPLVCNLTAYGLLMADDVLTRDYTYHIHGPVGVDPDSGAFIKHSYITQSLVATVKPQEAHIAGKAWISSTGKVIQVAWDNVSEEGEWHLTVQAEHEIFDPEKRTTLHFAITYCFGHFSPELSEMDNIQVNTVMRFEGLVTSKHPESNELIVQVLSHGFVVV
ncbi:uncharacterized protein MELLADRAFT_105533 [Melampsora larici-populina 98AG31]|uniref:Uncharacterized protein n=1 Tax=Melampsora larici-populina (strain 98AG31 / pathotype 3-4-7) TaxID=747676 RepID=F4RIJ1_MELLP|nr:uncharacterized protein MELLADRAFT_105533 [Melampsora larici-populina 98AG31]EGG07575.1 hypothetical protein MELLADRAFT_105533 [Melampsora larici-populina 98AG31]